MEHDLAVACSGTGRQLRQRGPHQRIEMTTSLGPESRKKLVEVNPPALRPLRCAQWKSGRTTVQYRRLEPAQRLARRSTRAAIHAQVARMNSGRRCF